MKKAVILLPTYNEIENLEKFIQEVFLQEKNRPGWKFEILIVDSGSQDGTLELAKKLSSSNHKIHSLLVGRGLGVALVEGHRYSLEHLKPDAMVQMDSDGQVEADVIPRMLKALDEGFDLAIGSRFAKGGKNYLPFLRKLSTIGACLVCRVVMGPADVGEFTNSARAFTPALFRKINFANIPWKENTYIIQPAFLHEAILAGAKYKEVPLVFKNRDEGYSKNKVINYTYDVLSYALDARFKMWGLEINFFYLSRKIKTFLKFGTVGFIGTIIDLTFYNIFIFLLKLPPATSKVMSSEVAVFNNFTFNNIWTFKHRKTNTKLIPRFLMFNLFSAGGIIMAGLIVKALHTLYGDGFVTISNFKIAYAELYFFATIPPVMTWNFTINHFITWRHQETSQLNGAKL